MNKVCWAAVLLPWLLTAAPAGEKGPKPDQQWPHWRGPLATGAAPHGDPPVTWDEKTNIKWKTEIPGRGSSTPVVWGDCVFVATALDTGRVAKAEDLPRTDPKLEKKTKAPNTYHRF